MKKIFCAIAILCLTSCAEGLRQDVVRLDKSLTDLRGFQAEQTSQISNLQTDVQALRGRLEELEYSQNKKLGGEFDSLKNQLSTLKRRVPPPAIVPATTLDEDEAFVTSLPQDISSKFGSALGTIREGSFNEAIPMLQTALDSSAGQDYSANILFWLGISYEGVGDNRNALLAFNQIVSVYPQHPRVPLALLRQSGVLAKIGDQKASTIILKKLVAEHPTTAEAAQARTRLKDN